jgi:hypothetical protein
MMLMRSLLVAAALLCVPVAAFSATGLGAREQWQPEVSDTDPRLEEPVEVEIIGRAAVPALEMLSEATGVSLSVAPEDLDTVGERKLTVVSKGLPLKAIMVQIPEALQECHWDIDESGEEPVYLLHRNAGVEQTMDWLSEQAAQRKREEKREKLVDRIALARQALRMSEEELAELEKTDLLLARSVRDPHSRDLLEILLSLPPEQMEQFQGMGSIATEYSQAPERLRGALHRIADWFIDRLSGENLPPEVRNWQDNLSHATVSFEDHRVGHGWGVWISLDIPHEQGYPAIHDVALHPRYCNLDEGQYCYTRLLTATSTVDEDTAFEMTMDMDREGFRVAAKRREERRKREWIEPTDPALLQTIVVGDQEFAEFVEAQAFVAGETGLPVISDYFTLRPPHIPDEVREGVPLWRLLYVLGEDDFHGDVYLWEKVGDCLLFHRVDWYRLAKTEIPEPVIADYRARMEAQGELTMDDLAELAVLVDAQDLHVSGFPRDLQRAGIYAALPDNRWGLLLYASLSSEQQGKLRSPQGLSFDEMTIAQQRQVVDRAAERPEKPTTNAAHLATFHLVESVEDSHGRTFAKTELQLRFPEVTDSAMVTFRLLPAEDQPKESAAPVAAP